MRESWFDEMRSSKRRDGGCTSRRVSSSIKTHTSKLSGTYKRVLGACVGDDEPDSLAWPGPGDNS